MQHGWISENRDGLPVTGDGGITWARTTHLYGADQFLSHVVFVTATLGWVLTYPSFVGSKYEDIPTLFETDDGAQTWTQLCTGDFSSCH
jgi:photosystem II stability/assembly factor-like uncharacterized protein